MHKLFLLSLIVCLQTVDISVSAQSMTPAQASTSSTARDASAPLQVTISGEAPGKPSLILLPGFACSGAVWEETVTHYQSRYTCYSFTMPGFAGAPAQTDPSLSAWVDAIAAYITTHKIANPTVIGHSLGGGMALMLAARYPERVSKVIVVDALPCLGAVMNPDFKVQEHPDCSAMINQMTTMNDSVFYRMEKMTMPRLITDTVHLPQVIQWGMRSDRRTYAGIYCQFSNTDLRETVGDIRCPVLVLLESGFVNIKPAIEGQYKKLAAARLVYADKGLHFIMFDDKEWYLQQTDLFLQP